MTMTSESPPDDVPDLRLRIFIWGFSSIGKPRIEYFASNHWDDAITRALHLSKTPERATRIQIVDAWGMQIAQFTHRRIIMGEAEFKKAYGT